MEPPALRKRMALFLKRICVLRLGGQPGEGDANRRTRPAARPKLDGQGYEGLRTRYLPGRKTYFGMPDIPLPEHGSLQILRCLFHLCCCCDSIHRGQYTTRSRKRAYLDRPAH